MNDTVSFIKFKKKSSIGNGEGKNSDVFLARDEQFESDLVIKQLKKEKFKPEEYFTEAKMLYENKHPNIVEIQYASQDEDFIYLAMPYYKRGSLNSLAETRFLSVREIVKYILDLLTAVNYIHSKGLLHLDIKPTNILLDDTGRALLTDFGLSRYMDENGIAEQPCNYILHTDPEWYCSSGRSVQSDIYQIGLTIYRLCNGVNILKEQYSQMGIKDQMQLKRKVLAGEFPKRNYFLPHIPSKLRKIVIKALKVDPEERYKNTIEMMNDLSDVQENLDWFFTGNFSEPYFKNDGTYGYSICINAKKHIECYRQKIGVSKKTKINKHCSEYENDNDLFSKLRSIIEALN